MELPFPRPVISVYSHQLNHLVTLVITFTNQTRIQSEQTGNQSGNASCR